MKNNMELLYTDDIGSEPQLKSNSATKKDVTNLIDEMSSETWTQLSLTNKDGIKLEISGSEMDGYCVIYIKHPKSYINTIDPTFDQIKKIAELFAVNNPEWETFLEFQFHEDVDELNVEAWKAIDITHGFQWYNLSLHGDLGTTNKRVVFTNNEGDWHEISPLNRIKSIYGSKFLLINNVIVIELLNGTYYKFLVKYNVRDDAIKIIKKTKNALTSNLDNEYKELTNQFALNIINVRNLVVKYFLFSNCQKCDSTRFTINDVNTKGTSIEVVCEYCEKTLWLKAIENLKDLPELKQSYDDYISTEPMFCYRLVDLFKHYDKISKKEQKLYKNILPNMKLANEIMEIELSEDEPECRVNQTDNQINSFEMIFDALDFRDHDLQGKIYELLKSGEKMGINEIQQRLNVSDVDTIRTQCEQLYINDKINRTKNYRYFIGETAVKSIKEKSSDNYEELKQLKQMQDDGLITEEDYETKKKELLGL